MHLFTQRDSEATPAQAAPFPSAAEATDLRKEKQRIALVGRRTGGRLPTPPLPPPPAGAAPDPDSSAGRSGSNIHGGGASPQGQPRGLEADR